VEFNSISGTITQRTRLTDVSGKDKCQLLNYLLEDLGLRKRLVTELSSDCYKELDKIWSEQTALNWND
jgi:hypothetical protein